MTETLFIVSRRSLKIKGNFQLLREGASSMSYHLQESIQDNINGLTKVFKDLLWLDIGKEVPESEDWAFGVSIFTLYTKGSSQKDNTFDISYSNVNTLIDMAATSLSQAVDHHRSSHKPKLTLVK